MSLDCHRKASTFSLRPYLSHPNFLAILSFWRVSFDEMGRIHASQRDGIPGHEMKQHPLVPNLASRSYCKKSPALFEPG